MTRLITLLGLSAAVTLAQFGLPQPSSKEPAASRSTPQKSVLAFLSAVHEGDFARANQFLDLDRIPEADRFRKGSEAARALGAIFDSAEGFEIRRVNNQPEGNLNDSLPPEREVVMRTMDRGLPLDLLIEMTRKSVSANAAPVWVFAAETVERAPSLKAASMDSTVERYLPSWIVRWSPFGTPLWRWAALLLALALAITISGVLSRGVLKLLKPLCERIDPKGNCNIVNMLLGPIRILVTVALFRSAAVWVPASAIARFYIGRILGVVVAVAVVWLLSRAIDIVVVRVRNALVTRHTSLSRSVLPLLSRVGKALLVVFAITATLASWGFDMTAILAGVGIGGIAIALAAQKTIENLFGGISIISDAPVSVGDFCKFGDRVGTIEDIGLRSTRIRTLDRTVVTVPNSEFSSMTLENYSRRDKIWFHPTFKLRKDTPPARVNEIVQEIDEILRAHPKMEVGTLPVRFVGSSDFSLDIELFAYVLTSDYDEFLKIQQEVYVQILTVISENGAELALPSQTAIYFKPNGSRNGSANGRASNEQDFALLSESD